MSRTAASSGGCTFADHRRADIEEYLTQCGVGWRLLTHLERQEAETAWRRAYGRAFEGRPRCRQGARAEDEYLRQPCDHYLVVAFSANVPGTPVTVHSAGNIAYECHGPLIPLGAFHTSEFFICPPDLSWTMVHTHEDYAFGGPYFIRSEWIVEH